MPRLLQPIRPRCLHRSILFKHARSQILTDSVPSFSKCVKYLTEPPTGLLDRCNAEALIANNRRPVRITPTSGKATSCVPVHPAKNIRKVYLSPYRNISVTFLTQIRFHIVLNAPLRMCLSNPIFVC